MEQSQVNYDPKNLLTEARHPWLVTTLVNNPEFVSEFLSALADQIHGDNVKAGWWTNPKTGEDLHGLGDDGKPKRNVPEMLMLIVSEVSEAMEGYRKKLQDDKLPQYPMLKVELIDAVIRILDLLGSEGNVEFPAGEIFMAKRAYNAVREDHKLENRLKAGGKEF